MIHKLFKLYYAKFSTVAYKMSRNFEEIHIKRVIAEIRYVEVYLGLFIMIVK